MKMNQMTSNRGNNMAKKTAPKSDRRLKNEHEVALDTWHCRKTNKEFVRSADKVFEQLGSWGCRWSDVGIGVLDNMQEAYEQMVLSKEQKEKEYVASSVEGVWDTTTHTNHYGPETS